MVQGDPDPDNPSSSSSSIQAHSIRHNKDHSLKDDPGIAFIQRPFHLSFEEEKELLEECRRRLKVMLELDSSSSSSHDGSSWHNRLYLSGVSITSKQDTDGGPFCMTKGVTAMPLGMTLEDVQRQLDFDNRDSNAVRRLFQRIDPMNYQMTIVTTLQTPECQALLDTVNKETVQLLWGAFYVAPLISDRDFLFVQHHVYTTCPVTGDPLYVSNSFSVEYPTAVPDMQTTLGRVRAHIETTGYIFRPLRPRQDNDHDNNHNPPQLSMTYVLQVDPKGLIPPPIVNLVSISQALNVGRIRDIYQHYHDVAQCLRVEPPLECYTLPRRGGAVIHTCQINTTMMGECGAGTAAAGRGKCVISNDEEKEESMTECTTTATSSGTQQETFQVRLCAYAEHSTTVQLLSDAIGTWRSNDADQSNQNNSASNMGAAAADLLVAGKVVKFGGKHHPTLDILLQITVDGNSKSSSSTTSSMITRIMMPDLTLKFTNPGWKKTTLYIPATMEATVLQQQQTASTNTIDKNLASSLMSLPLEQ